MARRPYTRNKPPIPQPPKTPAKPATQDSAIEWKVFPWGRVGWSPTSRTYSVNARIIVAGDEVTDQAGGFRNRGDVVAWLKAIGITWDPTRVEMK